MRVAYENENRRIVASNKGYEVQEKRNDNWITISKPFETIEQAFATLDED